MSSCPRRVGIVQSPTEGVIHKPTRLMQQVITSMQVAPNRESWSNRAEDTMDSTIHMVPCCSAGSSGMLITLRGGHPNAGTLWSPQILVEGLVVSSSTPPVVTWPTGLGLVMDLLPGWWLIILNAPCCGGATNVPLAWALQFLLQLLSLQFPWSGCSSSVGLDGAIICQLDGGSSPSTSASVKVAKGSMAWSPPFTSLIGGVCLDVVAGPSQPNIAGLWHMTKFSVAAACDNPACQTWCWNRQEPVMF